MSKSVYYCRFTGDYARDTSHLTLIQHGAYTVLLDFYYSSGKTLPPDMNALCRICRAFDDAERDAVSHVVSQFFELRADGYHNKRADAELTYRAEQRDRLSKGAKKTNAKRWGKDSSLGDSLGDTLGGRIPSPSPSPNPQKAKSKPAPKPAAPADPRHQAFVDFAVKAFEQKHSQRPTWTGKDFKALSVMLASNKGLVAGELEKRFGNYLASTEAFTQKQGDSLAYFCAHVDSFLAGPMLAAPQKGGSNADQRTSDNLRAAGLLPN